MVNYSDGKIYKIISNQTNKIYVGGTAEKYLSKRLAAHRSNFKKWKNNKYHYVSSFELIQYPDHKIILIEKYPCDSRDQLLAREQYWIDQNKDICLNIQNAFGKDLERSRQQQKQYRKINKDILEKKKKEYIEKNKELVSQRKKNWYMKNREKVL